MPEIFKDKDSANKAEAAKLKELNSKWTKEQELLLAEWSEKASCYRWLHGRAEKKYRRSNYAFTIPVIIMSTLTGTANFAMDSFVPQEHKKIAMAGVGGVNILAGIISTLQNFLRYAELMESHRSSGVSWSKLGRDISIELALDPPRRKPARDFLNICRAEYDRLIEQSPMIDDSILKQFHGKFYDSDINKPEMCNGLDKCEIYQPSKEEKAAEIMANVSTKLSNNKKRMFTVDTRPMPSTSEPAKSTVNESKRELDGLANLGRVSSLKKLNSIPKPKKEKKTIHDELKGILETNEGESLIPGKKIDVTDDTKGIVDSVIDTITDIDVKDDVEDTNVEDDMVVSAEVNIGDEESIGDEETSNTKDTQTDIETGNVDDTNVDDTNDDVPDKEDSSDLDESSKDFLSGIMDESTEK